MDFLTSDWFTWCVAIFLFLGYIAWQFENVEIEWDVIWHISKKIVGFILSMVLLPLIIIFNLIDEKRLEKKEGPQK